MYEYKNNHLNTCCAKLRIMTIYLELSKVEQTRQLERAPLVKVNPRTEEVESESG